MDMLLWAEREIKLAEKQIKKHEKEPVCDYEIACYASALKAYKSLVEDGHSGTSIDITKQILDRLIEGKPLTPIEDIDKNWEEVLSNAPNDRKVYQCLRMSSLFKEVYPDGTVKFNDVNSYYCIDINNPDISYVIGIVGQVLDMMFPITMPYMPDDPIKVYCEDFLYDAVNGDFDTIGILYIIPPDGEKISINRYFKEGKDGFEEIDLKEYRLRQAVSLYNERSKNE